MVYQLTDQNGLALIINSLFPVKALSIVFKAKFRDELRKLNPLLFNQISPSTWAKNWVVNSIPVGNGCHAMKYLAQYVFRVAISNNRIIKHQGGFVTFKYKDSKTKVHKFMKLTTEEFIRRFLQHVLPKGFVKVRYFGSVRHKKPESSLHCQATIRFYYYNQYKT